MKEAIANSAISTMVIVLIGIIMFVFLSSLAYTKAFKIKNRMLDIIEARDLGFHNPSSQTEIIAEIEELMRDVGYVWEKTPPKCNHFKNKGEEGIKLVHAGTNYHYCIYEVPHARGYMYRVVSHMYFDIPIVKGIKIPVMGDTLPFYETIDDERQICKYDYDCGYEQTCNGGSCK